MATLDDLTSKTKTTSAEGKRIALVVGTNNTKASSYLPDLKYAEDDAQEVYHTLRQPACNFEFICPVLTGDKAETRDVRRAVIKLAQEKADQNFLLFYFIGHAQPMKTKEGYDDIYFVTSDFNENEAKEDSTSHLSMRWLRDMLYRSDGAGRVLIILDCCYSGNIIHVGSDHSRMDLRTFIKGCIDGVGDIHQNGRLRVLLTATGYNTPAQERVMTNLFLSALQGRIARIIDHKGNINIHSLYTYLQDQMPIAQLPNLSGDFPIPCILAHYPEKSHQTQFTQQTEENEHWHTTVSQLVDKMSEISSVITDSDYFKRLAKANTFDRITEETAFIVDLNQDKVAEFLKRDRVQIQDDFYPESTQQDQLQYFSFLQGLHPTYGALLCFGINPTKWHAGAFTHCTLWRGNDQSNGWLDAQDYRRGLITQFEAGRDFLRRSLRLARTISMDERIEELEVPLIALEEALANALVHREYANQTSPVYIDIFSNRVEISSPGIPPEPMTMELLEEEHKSHPRNPQIARVFYLYQYVEKVGSGIQRMQRALANAGLPPARFELGKDRTFKVIFYRPEQASEEAIHSTSKVSSPVTIFCSYAHKDEVFYQQLDLHLSDLQRQGLISLWHDRQIVAGMEWRGQVDTHLESASVILLLVSSDFLASDYCYGIEMQRALEQHRNGKAHVIPIIVRSCDWQDAPFAHLPCLPRDGKPVTSWVNQDEAFVSIVRELRRITMQQQSFNPSLSTVARQNRVRLLKRVRTWTEGVLEHSLQNAPSISLDLQEQPDALANPWLREVPELSEAPRQLPAGTSIIEVHDAADGELLILGEPGSGKTTLLLELAQALLKRAETDESYPIPVIFNLSSWSQTRQPLAVWQINELRTVYLVGNKIAQDLIDTDQILPLLDGLDEVIEDVRADCVKAINVYLQHRREKGFAPLVLSCRSQEYSALTTRVILQQAVNIQPLTSEQIEHYLQSIPGRLEGLRQVLYDDAKLYKLVRRPLMLNIFVLAYEGAAPEEFLKEGKREALLHQIFARYVERMLQRRTIPAHYSSQQTQHWLSWLAKQIMRGGQTEFSKKQMSPDWLPNNRLRVAYYINVGLIFGLIFGMATGLITGLISNLLGGLIGGLVIGLACGLLFGMGLIRNSPIEHFVLRIFLWCIGAIPWNYTRFLDYSVEHLLLQKVGDRYLFPHQSLMEYFANTERNVTSELR